MKILEQIANIGIRNYSKIENKKMNKKEKIHQKIKDNIPEYYASSDGIKFIFDNYKICSIHKCSVLGDYEVIIKIGEKFIEAIFCKKTYNIYYAYLLGHECTFGVYYEIGRSTFVYCDPIKEVRGDNLKEVK